MASKPKPMNTLLEVLKLAELGYKIKVLERKTVVPVAQLFKTNEKF